MRKKRKKQAPKPHPYRKRLAWRAFFSLVLILAALYIRENEPDAALWAREQLQTSTDLDAVRVFMEQEMPKIRWGTQKTEENL